MFKSQFFKTYLLPGFMFQSVVIVGGYGTGRELMEYFLSIGPKSGLLAMLVTTIIWGCVCALTFEFARVFKAYDYRKFFQALLGPKLWHLFEIVYLCLVIVVLAIIAAATGSIMSIIFGYPFNYGVIGLACVICFLALHGSKLIETLFSYWSLVLYATYLAFFTACYLLFGKDIALNFNHASIQPGWGHNGITYACYNLGFIPAVFFCLHHLQTRKQAICSGLFAGVFAMLPGVFFLVAACAFYPDIVNIDIPSTYILQAAKIKWLLILFHVVLLGSLIETGTSMIHAINERLHTHWLQRAKSPPKHYRAWCALFFLAASMLVAQLGLSTLIAKGYGTLTWFFLAVYIIPLFTIGLWRLIKNRSTQ